MIANSEDSQSEKFTDHVPVGNLFAKSAAIPKQNITVEELYKIEALKKEVDNNLAGLEPASM